MSIDELEEGKTYINNNGGYYKIIDNILHVTMPSFIFPDWVAIIIRSDKDIKEIENDEFYEFSYINKKKQEIRDRRYKEQLKKAENIIREEKLNVIRHEWSASLSKHRIHQVVKEFNDEWQDERGE